MSEPLESSVVLITGIMASGKSTVAQALAERLPQAAHVRGDVFRRMVVSGRVEMGPDLDPSAVAQLRLRYRLAARTADAYAEAGFTAVLQDIVIGEEFAPYVRLVRTRPLYVVVLAPRPHAVAAREAGRSKTGYGEGWTPHALDEELRARTPRVGLWLDSSEQTPQQTVDEILARLPEAAVTTCP
ncbi:AAA family ATPase [Streptomyces sp. NPDC005963]|uniref:AAA family ATPase n=1 Tax=Streptomyces sp. NPDC005963 TaxID=3156721 RepID=UPI0033FD62A3